MKLHDQIRTAIGAHGMGKGRLQAAIDTKVLGASSAIP